MKILAIGAHPDDIEFGCGGTLLAYTKHQHRVHLLILTDGSYGGNPALRKREAHKAAAFLGAQRLFWGGYPDTELTDNRSLINTIDTCISHVKPDVVFMNYPDDVHQDHRAAARASITATRYIREVLFYEVPTTQSFEPDIFVDIHPYLVRKLKLLKIHASQIDKTRVQDLTILESAKSCANFRGYQGRVKFAEGFKALRLLRDI